MRIKKLKVYTSNNAVRKKTARQHVKTNRKLEKNAAKPNKEKQDPRHRNINEATINAKKTKRLGQVKLNGHVQKRSLITCRSA